MKYRMVVYLRSGIVHTTGWMDDVTFQKIKDHRQLVLDGDDLIFDDAVSGRNIAFKNNAIDAISIECGLTFKEKIIDFFTLGD